jgi:hypothetical protein
MRKLTAMYPYGNWRKRPVYAKHLQNIQMAKQIPARERTRGYKLCKNFTE